MLIAALVGGGASVAAESALPGDTLYPIKISMNEEVRAAFAFSPEAKAKWETRRAERRLEEASELAAEGKLAADSRAQLEDSFKAHADRAQSKIAEVKVKGNVHAAADISSDFETSLRAFEKVLSELEIKLEAHPDVQVEIKPIVITIKNRLDTTAKSRASFEEEIGEEDGKPETKAAAEGRIKAVKNFIASTRSYIEVRKVRLGAEATAKAQVRLVEAEKVVVQAEAKVKAEAYGEAFVLASRAMRIAQEARFLAAAEIKLEIRIHKDEMDDDEDDEMETEDENGSKNDEDDNNGKEDDDDDARFESKTEVEVESEGGGVKGSGKIEIDL